MDWFKKEKSSLCFRTRILTLKMGEFKRANKQEVKGSEVLKEHIDFIKDKNVPFQTTQPIIVL
jgi:hypothetical protein